jgi:hypothetical protein
VLEKPAQVDPPRASPASASPAAQEYEIASAPTVATTTAGLRLSDVNQIFANPEPKGSSFDPPQLDGKTQPNPPVISMKQTLLVLSTFVSLLVSFLTGIVERPERVVKDPPQERRQFKSCPVGRDMFTHCFNVSELIAGGLCYLARKCQFSLGIGDSRQICNGTSFRLFIGPWLAIFQIIAVSIAVDLSRLANKHHQETLFARVVLLCIDRALHVLHRSLTVGLSTCSLLCPSAPSPLLAPPPRLRIRETSKPNKMTKEA